MNWTTLVVARDLSGMNVTTDGSEEHAIALVQADLSNADDQAIVLTLTREYFDWMNVQIQQAMGCSIPELVGMELDAYITAMMTTICRSTPPESAFYLAKIDGQTVGLGGLRRLPDGSAEVVRLYTRPQNRGHGIGKRLVQTLINEARRFGYSTLKLDTGSFMTAAQAIYRAAGFKEIEPYDGAEPPEALHPIWLYLQKTL